jgi:hypothetical protein
MACMMRECFSPTRYILLTPTAQHSVLSDDCSASLVVMFALVCVCVKAQC